MDHQSACGDDKTPRSRPTDETRQPQQPLEADPRFPSGKWQGYLLIPPERSVNSMTLELKFSGGTLSGTGRDACAAFTVTGTYGHDGSCRFEKMYSNGQITRLAGYHVSQAQYFGISGDWVLVPDERWHDRFWIEPVSEKIP